MAIINQWPMSETKVLGGGGPGMYSVVLPRSVYWASASEWVQVNSQQPPASADGIRPQVVCNGNLWVMDFANHTAYAVDLVTGNTVDQITDAANLISSVNSQICTDGQRYIWTCRNEQTAGDTAVSYVIQIDVIEKTIATLTAMGFSDIWQTSTAKWIMLGPMVYSSKYNALFVFGQFFSKVTRYKGSAYRLNLSDNSVVSLAQLSANHIYGYAWSDEETGDIYIGGGSYTNNIDRYTPESNTYTTIRTDFTMTGGWGGCIPIGDTIYNVTAQGITPFDPKTGETREGPTPTNPGFEVNTGYCASSGNTLYLSHSTGLYKCALYENIPEEAPIVAKIYKGQKYHTLQPFTIHGEGGDVNVTTTQQTAAADIPIKMYTYDNAGGQVLIIENGGE